MSDHDSLPPLEEVLAAHPDWDRLTAFERTKLCCAELTRRGERLPSWSVIRDIIGKGSAQDINRAKEAFRREHAEMLRRLGRAVDGIPDELQNLFVEVWRQALAVARDTLAAETVTLREQLAAFEQRLRLAEAVAERAQKLSDEAEARARELQERLDQETSRANALQDALARADQEMERVLALREADKAAHAEEAARQRAQLQAALERLEGAEAFALRRIEDARREAAERVAEELQAARERVAFLEARLEQTQKLHDDALATVADLRKELAARRKEAEAFLTMIGRKGRSAFRRWK